MPRQTSPYSLGLVALVVSFGMYILWIIIMRSTLRDDACDCHPVFLVKGSSNEFHSWNVSYAGYNDTQIGQLKVNKMTERKLNRNAISTNKYLTNISHSKASGFDSFAKEKETIALNRMENKHEKSWQKYESCPQNVKISILGDSTAFRTHIAMLRILGCRMAKKEILGGKGHLPGIKYFSQSGNILCFFCPFIGILL